MFEKLPVRVPTAKPTRWHKDKSKYNRRVGKKELKKEISNNKSAEEGK